MGTHYGTRPKGNNRVVPINIVYDQQVTYVATFGAFGGPEVPNTVDDKYIGVLIEVVSSANNPSVPSGWTLIHGIPGLSTGQRALAVCFKHLSVSDRGTRPGVLGGTQQWDALILFKNTFNYPITSVTVENIVFEWNTFGQTKTLNSSAPTVSEKSAAICIFNGDSQIQQSIMTPTGTILNHTDESGSEYKIYQPGDTLQNATTQSNIARQGLCWLVIS